MHLGFCCLCVFLSTAQYNTGSFAMSVKRSGSWYNSLPQKFRNVMHYCLAFTPEPPTETFLSVRVSIWRRCRGFTKRWLNLILITKVGKNGKHTLIILKRNELPNVLVRASHWTWRPYIKGFEKVVLFCVNMNAGRTYVWQTCFTQCGTSRRTQSWLSDNICNHITPYILPPNSPKLQHPWL